MKTRVNLFRSVVLMALLMFSGILSINAQLYYQDSHLFIGQKPVEWTEVGDAPGAYIGPNFGIEFVENGLNFWRPYPSPDFGNYKLFLDQTGKLGVGRKPTTYALEVNGQIWSTGGVVTTSDERLKRNIVNLSGHPSDYLGKLLKLNGKSYDKQISSNEGNAEEVSKMVADGKIKKEDASVALAALNESNPTVYKKEFGFIAQEVKELFPELVEESKDGVYAVNYTGLIPVCWRQSRNYKKE